MLDQKQTYLITSPPSMRSFALSLLMSAMYSVRLLPMLRSSLFQGSLSTLWSLERAHPAWLVDHLIGTRGQLAQLERRRTGRNGCQFPPILVCPSFGYIHPVPILCWYLLLLSFYIYSNSSIFFFFFFFFFFSLLYLSLPSNSSQIAFLFSSSVDRLIWRSTFVLVLCVKNK